MLSKSKIFLILCLGFVVGVFLGKYLSYEIMAVLAMIFVIITALGWKNRTVVVIGLAGIMMLVGAWRLMSDVSQNDLAGLYGQKISGEGTIMQEPDERSDKIFLTLGKVIIDEKIYGSKILLIVRRFPEFEYGERISFEGKLSEPQDAESTGEFSYKNYLSRFGITGLVYYPKSEVLAAQQGNMIKYNLLKFKKLFVLKLAQVLPEPQNSFLAGLLVGLRKTIPEDLTDALSITGTTHVIAISGFNITIIATAINGLLLRFFKRKISCIIALIAIGLLLILAGASASAVRAGIMGALGMLALNIGRVNSITNALALTAAVMLAVNPQILYFDAGFQLSFLALMGLVYLVLILEPKFLWVPKWLRIYFLPTIAAYIFTLPLLLYHFDRLSLVAIPVNILVLPMIPAAMLFGFITGSLALIWPILAYPTAWLSWGALTYVLEIVRWAAKIPFAAANWHLNLGWGGLCYLILVSWIFYKKVWILKLKTS